MNERFVGLDASRFWGRLSNRYHTWPWVRAVDACFEVGGYVAGGFARFLGAMSDTTDAEFHVQLARYLVNETGDVDMWFPNDVARARWEYLAELRTGPSLVHCNRSTPFATSYVTPYTCMGTPGVVRLQAIRCVFGPPRHVMAQFDFFNSQFAFGATWAEASREAVEAEGLRLLRVAHMADASLLVRIAKYRTKYLYTGLWPGQDTELVTYIMNVSEWFRASLAEASDFDRPMLESSARSWGYRVRNLVGPAGVLADEDVLLLGIPLRMGVGGGAKDPDDMYNYAWRPNPLEFVAKRHRMKVDRLCIGPGGRPPEENDYRFKQVVRAIESTQENGHPTS